MTRSLPLFLLALIASQAAAEPYQSTAPALSSVPASSSRK